MGKSIVVILYVFIAPYILTAGSRNDHREEKVITKFAKGLMVFASWKTVMLALVLASAAIGVLNGIATPRVVEATGGLEPFDVLWPLSTTEIVAGLAAYNSDAQQAYLLFAAIDIPFPVFAGLFQVLLWCWLIKWSGISALISLAERGVVLLAFVPTLFDLYSCYPITRY